MRLWLHDRGAVAVSGALSLVVLLGFAALAVDVGSFFYQKRRLQSAADLAAMAAASDIRRGRAAAEATVRNNGYSVADMEAFALGVYVADPALAPEARFTATSAPAGQNAAQIDLSVEVPTYFGRVINGRGTERIDASAVATRTAFANFAIGSRLAALRGGLPNALLGGLLGSEIELSVMDYEALAQADIDLFQFSSALAQDLNLTAVSYDQLLDHNVSAAKALSSLATAAGESTPAGRALQQLADAAPSGGPQFQLDALLDLGPYGGLTAGANPSGAARATVNALNMVNAVASAAGGQRQVELELDGALPAGLANATLRLAIGEPPQGSSWVAVGAEGAVVRTAQTRLLLTVQAVGTGATSLVTLPIYLELAPSSARLAAIDCGFPDIASSSATLDVQPGLADAWIGSVPTNAFYNLQTPLGPGKANIVNAPPLLRVKARSHAQIAHPQAVPVAFSYPEIEAGEAKRARTRLAGQTLVSDLLARTELQVEVLGLGLGLGGPATTAALRKTLSAVEAPVATLLDGVLEVLGVSIGEADVWVRGVRCDGAVLVG